MPTLREVVSRVQEARKGFMSKTIYSRGRLEVAGRQRELDRVLCCSFLWCCFVRYLEFRVWTCVHEGAL